jgi:DDE superfamily endonuclease
MARRYGRSPRGERLVASAPHGHWKTSTFIAGLRHDKIVAPYIIDDAVNGEIFRAHVEQVLAHTLTAQDIVIMDNLRCHKVAGVREPIEAKAASMLYLPAYSLDLNPIEQVVAKLKALPCKAAARSVTKVMDRHLLHDRPLRGRLMHQLRCPSRLSTAIVKMLQEARSDMVATFTRVRRCVAC